MCRAERHGKERGLSLVELLVAMTILAIATTMAFVLYDNAHRSYKRGENVTEQQQIVRIAFDMVVSDLRMAGFNTNPDGDRNRPDEQLELALPAAIVLRADFDAEDPAERQVPELALSGAGSAFLSVSTGNDEIRGYVLAKPDGSSVEMLDFDADVGQAVRDGVVERVDVGGIALTLDDPPYTLYRISLDNDPAGCCGGGFITRTPVADNIRSIGFRYFDQAGNELAPEGGLDTPAALAMRGAVRRIRVDIEGLTRDPDATWIDPADPDPDTRFFNKFSLGSDVTPTNLGFSGIKDYRADTSAPSEPAAPQLHPGHCGGIYASWPPNPPENEVVYYRILYGEDPLDPDRQRSTRQPRIYLGGLDDDVQYWVSVQAVDAAGNRSDASAPVAVTTSNTNTPESPANPTLTSGLNGRIDLEWDAALVNTAVTFGDPESPLLRDLAGYRIYRDDHTGFNPDSGERIADETDVPALPQPTYSDGTVINCMPYFYRIAAIDRCGVESAYSVELTGSSWSDVDPRAPLNVEAHWAGANVIRLDWSEVREDVNNDSIHVETYNIYRTPFLPEATANPGPFNYHAQVTDVTEFLDAVIIPPGDMVWYTISAVDSCAPANESAQSDWTRPVCTFDGQVTFPDLEYDAAVWGPTDIRVEVAGAAGGADYEALHLTFENDSSGDTINVDLVQAGPSWVYPWDAQPDAMGPGFFSKAPWRITAVVDQRIGADVCTASRSIRLIVDDD